MDWFITLEHDELLLIVYSYNPNMYRGETVLKIPIKKINEKIKELNISNLIN